VSVKNVIAPAGEIWQAQNSLLAQVSYSIFSCAVVWANHITKRRARDVKE
jgi:hypothetical protein